jgi:hypothetical protein
MSITPHEAMVVLAIAVVLAVCWWLARPRSGRPRAARVSARHKDLLVRFRNVVIDERARERVLEYYRQKYPDDPIECVLEKILDDYQADNNSVTGGRWFRG